MAELTKEKLAALWASYHSNNQQTVKEFIDFIFGGSGTGNPFLPLAGGQMSGDIDMNEKKLKFAELISFGSVGQSSLEYSGGNLFLKNQNIGGFVNVQSDNINITNGGVGTGLTLGSGNGNLAFFAGVARAKQNVSATGFTLAVDLPSAITAVNQVSNVLFQLRAALGDGVTGYNLVNLI